MKHVVVIGGGIGGLAAAHRIRRAAPDVRVTVLEASDRLGGVIRSTAEDGYVLESGPDLFLASKPGAWELAGELGIQHRLHGTSPRAAGSYILSRGKLHRVPEGMTGLVPTKMMPFVRTRLISPLSKLRVAMDFVIPPLQDDTDESIESFVVRRLGRGMYDRLVEPLLSGIFAGDGSRLSILATFPHLRAAERKHGGLGRAMLAAKRAPKAPGTSGRPAGFVSFPLGLAELVDALVDALRQDPEKVTLRTRTRALSVRRNGARWTVGLARWEALEADAVIVATPAYASADLLGAFEPEAAAALRRIPHVASATVNIAYDRADIAHPLNATGWTTPRIERREVLACTWTSSKFDGRAPDGMALFRAFVGDATNQRLATADDAEVVRAVRDELRLVLGVTAEPKLVQVNRFERGMPQYDLGHLDRVATVDAAVARHPGLAVAGNAYRGVGVPDVIQSGERAAQSVLAHLGALPDDTDLTGAPARALSRSSS